MRRIGKFTAFPGKGLLLWCQVIHIFKKQALPINKVEFLTGFLFRKTLVEHFLVNPMGNAAAGRPSAKAQIGLVLEGLTGNPEGAQDTGKGNNAGSFNVVIKDGIAIHISVQDLGSM